MFVSLKIYFYNMCLRQEPKQTETVQGSCLAACSSWLAKPDFLDNAGPLAQVAPPTVHWTLPHQSRKCPIVLPTDPADGGVFSIGVPFP